MKKEYRPLMKTFYREVGLLILGAGAALAVLLTQLNS